MLFMYELNCGITTRIFEHVFLKKNDKLIMENTMGLWIYWIIWNSLLVGVVKFGFWDSFVLLNEFLKKFNMLTKIICWILCIIIIFSIYIIIDGISELIYKYLNLIENPSPIEFIPSDKRIPLKTFLTKRLFFNTKTVNEIVDIYSRMVFSKNVLNENITVLFSGLPGVGKTQCAKQIVKLLNGGYLIHISRLIPLKALGIEILKKTFERAKKENRVIFIDDGEIGLIKREILLKKKQEENPIYITMEALIYTIMDLMSTTNVHIIIATNMSQSMLDKSISRRLKIIYEFLLPDIDQLYGIWGLWIPNNTINKENLVKCYSSESIGFSGRDILFINEAVDDQYNNTKFVLKVISQMKQKKDIKLNGVCKRLYETWLKKESESDSFDIMKKYHQDI